MKLNSISEINVMILDDEVMILRDLEDILLDLGIKNIYLCQSAEEAKSSILKTRIDLILCDIHLGDNQPNGVDLMKEIKESIYEPIEIIYISAFMNTSLLKEIESTSPRNYLLKPFSENQAVMSLKLAFNSMLNKTYPISNLEILTNSELKIIQMIKEGKNTMGIANDLFVSAKTIKNHRYNICKKLNLPSEKNSLLKWVMKNWK